MQETCRRHSIRQRMQESLYQTADAGDTLSDSRQMQLQKSLYQTADAGDTLSIRLRQTADAGVSLLDSGCRRHSIRQRMQEMQRMQESLYQTADAGDTLSD